MIVMREKDRQMREIDCDDCHERERLWWLSWERKIGTGQMRERLQEVSVMGRLLSTQPIHCTPKPLCIVSRYILHCIALCGIMIHSQALNSVPKRPDGSQRLSLWLWYRLGSRQPGIIAPIIFSIREAITREKCSFFEHCSKSLWPSPPHSCEHYVVNFSEGILAKVRKHLSRQLSTKEQVNLW